MDAFSFIWTLQAITLFFAVLLAVALLGFCFAAAYAASK